LSQTSSASLTSLSSSFISHRRRRRLTHNEQSPCLPYYCSCPVAQGGRSCHLFKRVAKEQQWQLR
jgi:hypothetical protein